MRKLKLPVVLVLLVLMGLAAWGGIYAYDKGFTKKWRRLLLEELDARGITADIGRLTIDPFRGLVAREVRIFEDEEHQILLASIDDITLDIDLPRLLRREAFLRTIDFRDADIDFPVDPSDPTGERLVITNFSARVQMPGEHIEINEVRFRFQGLDVLISGSLLRPAERRNTSWRKESLQIDALRKRRHLLKRFSDEMAKFDFSRGPPPKLEVELVGDLEKPDSVEARLHLSALNPGRGNFYCDQLEADLEYTAQGVELKRVYIRDHIGELHASGLYSLDSGELEFQLNSSIDAHTLARSLFDTQNLGEVVFYSPPKLNCSGTLYTHEAPDEREGWPARLVGNFSCTLFATRGQAFEGFEAEFSIDHERQFLRNLLLEHKTGIAAATFLNDPDAGGLRYTGSIEMDPSIFMAFIGEGKPRDFLKHFDFGDNPGVNLQFSGTGESYDPTTWTASGRLGIGPCSYRAIPLEMAVAVFDWSPRLIEFRDFRIDREVGYIEGDRAHIDSDSGLLTLSRVRGRTQPAPVVGYFSEDIAKVVKRYRFPDAPSLSLGGVIDLGDSKRTDLDIAIDAAGGVEFDFLGKPLPFDSATAGIHIGGAELRLDLDTQLLGGNATFDSTFSLAHGDASYYGNAHVSNVDFGRLADVYRLQTSTTGKLGGNWDFNAPGGELDAMSGSGEARIEDGNVFAIPFLGPLSKLLDAATPNRKTGHSIAREAGATFTMENGVLRTDDFEALANAFRIRGQGTIDLANDQLALSARMNARGPAGLLLFPVSKILEYAAEGPIGDPQWRPAVFTQAPDTGTPAHTEAESEVEAARLRRRPGESIKSGR